MYRFFVCLIALAVLCIPASTAFAACEEVTINVTLTVVGQYTDNTTDYNADAPDAVGNFSTGVNITLDNRCTDKVSTSMYLYNFTPIVDVNNADIAVCYAYISIEDFVSEGVTLTVGGLSLGWEGRTSLGSGIVSKIDPSNMGSYFVLYAFPVGMQVKYAFSESTSIELTYSKFIENSGRPGFTNSDDLDLYYVCFNHAIDESANVFGAFFYWNDQKEVLPGKIWMLDAGITHLMMDGCLDLYGEFVYQGGTAHAAATDLGAFALNAGCEYTFADVASAPYLGLNVTAYSGAKTGATATAAYDRYTANMNLTLIAENDYFGQLQNWTPGWMGVKLMGGLKKIDGGKFSADFIFGYYRAMGDISPVGRGKGLGYEVDALAEYNYMENLYFVLGLGYFSPDDDLAGPDPDGVWRVVFAVTAQF
ncbi:MAG: hypothetical protein WC712_11655 [Candidatus Brocadiia bacterium]